MPERAIIDRGAPPSLATMLRQGARDLRAYPGLFACLYLIQLALSGGAALIAGILMTAAWGKSAALERAAGGDAAALIHLLSDSPHLITALFWLLAGAVALHTLLSWYLSGGLNAVLLSRPSTRRDTARDFGAGGASTFPAYLRLGLLSLLPYAIIATSAGIGLAAVKERLQYALTMGDILSALLLALLPALLLWWIHGSAVSYARIALSRSALRADRPAAARALLRAYRLVLTRRQPLIHVLLYALWFLTVSLLFAAITWSIPAAAAAAVALFLLRQLTALLRSAAAFALAGGQVILGNSVHVSTDASGDTATPPPAMEARKNLTIRVEQPEDVPAIRRVNELAFGQPQEAALVDALRSAAGVTLSLVAIDGSDLVGHVLFSPVTIRSDEDPSEDQRFDAVGLGPMAVRPDVQRRGVGAALVRAGLQRLREAGHLAVVVLGHPAYYPRFGFRRASELGIRWEQEAPEEAFMVLELQQGSLQNRAGIVSYRPEFDDV